jgi:hypothetical protein
MRFRAAFTAALLAACSDESQPEEPAAAFPEDYASSYTELRDCRKSGDHDLSFVRILADARATAPYANRAEAFPDGAVVLKEEYEFDDDTCSGEILRWTVMVKASAATERLGWNWQHVGPDRSVVEQNGSRCQTCHADCGPSSAFGYDYTCAEP